MKTIQRLHPYLIGILLLFGIPVFSGHSEAQEIKAELNPTTFGIGQSATLQITVNGSQSADIIMPDVDGLAFHRRGQSSQIQIINRAVTSTVVYSYLVQAQKAGTYTIPAITVTIDGREHQTTPISCTITQISGTPPGSGQMGSTPKQQSSRTAEQSTFISFVPEKNQGYLSEAVRAKIKVYFHKGLTVNQISLPQFQGNGLLLDKLSDKPLQTEEIVNNESYSVLIWDTYITGVKEGNYNLEFEVDAALLIRSRQPTPPPGLGSSFFNDFFSDYSNKPIRITSPEIPFQVLPLPESGKPDGFTGAIGSFNLKVTAQPISVEAGEPITLTMSVAGTGNFDNVKEPIISEPAGIKTYTPNETFTPDQNPHQGEKRFEQAVIIAEPTLQQIPPIVFSFFDPEKGKYQTLFSDPIDITVTSSPIARDPKRTDQPTYAPHQAEAGQVETSRSISLAPVKLESDRVVTTLRPLFLAPWFLASLLICTLAIAGLSGFRVYRSARDNRPETLHRKALFHKRKQTLERLENLAGKELSLYLVETQSLLCEFLATLLQTEGSSLTAADIVQEFGDTSAVAELFRLSDQLQYSLLEPQAVDQKQLHENLISFVRGV